MGSWTLPDVSRGGGQEVVLCELDFKVSSIQQLLVEHLFCASQALTLGTVFSSEHHRPTSPLLTP